MIMIEQLSSTAAKAQGGSSLRCRRAHSLSLPAFPAPKSVQVIPVRMMPTWGVSSLNWPLS